MTVTSLRRRAAVFVSLLLVVGSSTTLRSDDHPPARKPAGPTLRIVKDTLIDSDNFYIVKGNIYNPNNDGVKNVVIKYYVWKKWMGKDGHGSAIKETGGLVSAKIKYLPPKQTVDFVANDGTAPVMTPESGLVPDPISAEITADWDE